MMFFIVFLSLIFGIVDLLIWFLFGVRIGELGVWIFFLIGSGRCGGLVRYIFVRLLLEMRFDFFNVVWCVVVCV